MRFTCFLVFIDSLFLFLALIVFHNKYLSVFIHSAVDDNLGCFRWRSINSAAMNILLCLLMRGHTFLCGLRLTVKLLSHRLHASTTSINNAKLFSKVFVLICLPTSNISISTALNPDHNLASQFN